MEKVIELARAFYGVLIPRRSRNDFIEKVTMHLNERYSIETAIGLAIRELKLQ
ncbi:MAG: hypothetical protein HY963_06105 [Ignavibacteriales bacterium]|nr:hypothetical protein [Ignavibacteriales bacterium]